MSLQRFRSPKLLDKHEAIAAAEKSVAQVEESEQKEQQIIKKSSKKN